MWVLMVDWRQLRRLVVSSVGAGRELFVVMDKESTNDTAAKLWCVRDGSSRCLLRPGEFFAATEFASRALEARPSLSN